MSPPPLPSWPLQVSLVAFGCLLTTGAVHHQDTPPPTVLTVFAAASLTDAFQELGRTLELQTPGLTVVFNFAGSQQLALQLEQGAAADVFASADSRWMTYAREHALLAGEPRLFARNRLVAIVPKSNPARIGGLPDLARRGIKLVLAAEAVPVGGYSREALHHLAKAPRFPADYATRVLANVVSQEDNVKGVVTKVQLGEADAGIVYRSDVTSAVGRYVTAIDIPEEYNVLAAYPIALARGAKNQDAARAFIALVLSADGQRVLEANGLMAARAGDSAVGPSARP